MHEIEGCPGSPIQAVERPPKDRSPRAISEAPHSLRLQGAGWKILELIQRQVAWNSFRFGDSPPSKFCSSGGTYQTAGTHNLCAVGALPPPQPAAREEGPQPCHVWHPKLGQAHRRRLWVLRKGQPDRGTWGRLLGDPEGPQWSGVSHRRWDSSEARRTRTGVPTEQRATLKAPPSPLAPGQAPKCQPGLPACPQPRPALCPVALHTVRPLLSPLGSDRATRGGQRLRGTHALGQAPLVRAPHPSVATPWRLHQADGHTVGSDRASQEMLGTHCDLPTVTVGGPSRGSPVRGLTRQLTGHPGVGGGAAAPAAPKHTPCPCRLAPEGRQASGAAGLPRPPSGWTPERLEHGL